MIRSEIIITLSTGRTLSWANKYLAEKTGDDNAPDVEILSHKDGRVLETRENKTKLKNGISGVCYYYTGKGDDKYEDQTGLGKVKGDYDYLVGQLDTAGIDFLRFPEADIEHADTTDYVKVVGNEKFTEKIKMSEIVSIKLEEKFVSFEGESKMDAGDYYALSRNEMQDRKFREYDRGPDFAAHKKTFEDVIAENEAKRKGE